MAEGADSGDATTPSSPKASDDAATVVDVKPRSAPRGERKESERPPTLDGALEASSRSGGSSRSTSVVTARETLLLQEIAQTRAFVRLAIVLATVVALAITFLGGDPFAKTLLYLALVAVVLACGWLGLQIREDEGYSIGKVLVAAFTCVGAAFAAIHYFGVFSPAVIIIPFGLCFFSAGANLRWTVAVFLSCAIGELILGVLTVTGAIPDRGIVRGEGVGAVERLAMLTLIEAIFLATYVIMRASRAATLRAIELHDQALAQISQREALLKEARQDLAQALRAGVGRYTDHTLGGFKLGDVIGRGAMGEVYDAVHVQTGQPAAVKVLLDHALAQPEHVQRFFREARLAASLDVPNVVRILAVADVDAAIPYLAMERLHGVDLADWLREHRRMSFGRLLGMIRQVGVGLRAARAAGIVHRDLKPRNLFLAQEGEREIWKILDFGVSKLVSDEHTLTRDRIVGTPTYMAPEQIDARPVSHRTDLFALGVIVYRALTGRPAFTGDVESQIFYKVVHAMPPAPSTLIAVPREVDLVMAIALAKSPDDRFDDAAELADALDAASKNTIEPSLAARAQKLLELHPFER